VRKWFSRQMRARRRFAGGIGRIRMREMTASLRLWNTSLFGGYLVMKARLKTDSV
jgi:hypothetical protein